MGRSQRAKGKRGQREAAQLLRECGWDDAHTEAGAQSDGARVPDVDAPGLPLWVECKFSKRPNILEAFRQAVRDSKGTGKQPAVMCRIVDAEGAKDDPCREWMITAPAWWVLCKLSELDRRCDSE